MQRRLLLLLRLCQHPRVLVLDEPANGLDAAARRQFLDLLVEFVCGPGRTVLFASHLLQDLERVVDHVAIIHQGRSLLQGELDDLKKRIRQVHLPATVSMDDLAGCGSVLGYRQGPHGVTALIRDLRAEAFASLVSRQGRQGHTDVHGLNLDDLFVALTRNDNQALAHAATTGADGRDSR
jgi:ABC-2 type transport system ATP-binding protein